MRKASERMKLKSAPDFNLKDANGKAFTLAQATGGKPALIVFVKDGCPCSIEAEPVLQALAKHHGEHIRMIGIFDKGAKEAKAWMANNETKHLFLIDPSLATMKAYHSPNSVYITLVAPDGKIEKQWPGWSKRILTEANSLLAKLSGQPERKFDTLYAPGEDSSGCSFYPETKKP